MSTALAQGNFCPAVRRKFVFHSRCDFAKCSLKVFFITSEGWLPIPLPQVVVKHPYFCQTEEGSINNLFGHERCVPQLCVGYAVGDLLEERFNWGFEIVPRRHLLLVFLQVELIDGSVGGDQLVEELPQGHFCISHVFMLEGLVVDLGHQVQR